MSVLTLLSLYIYLFKHKRSNTQIWLVYSLQCNAAVDYVSWKALCLLLNSRANLLTSFTFSKKSCRYTSVLTVLSQLIYGFCLIMSLCNWFACRLFFFFSFAYSALTNFSSAGKVHIAEYLTICFLWPIPMMKHTVWWWIILHDLCSLFLHRVRPQFFLLRRAASLCFPCMLACSFLLLAWPTECSTMFVCGHGSFCCRTLPILSFCWGKIYYHVSAEFDKFQRLHLKQQSSRTKTFTYK